MTQQDLFMLLNMGSAMFVAFYVHIESFNFKISAKWKLWAIFIAIAIAGDPLRQVIDSQNSTALNFFAVFTMYNFLPILIFATGSVWGKLYCFYLQASVSFSLALFASFIAQVFAEYDSSQYLIIWTILTLAFYTLYSLFMRKYGNTLFKNLFVYIKGKVWVMFSFLPYLSLIVIKSVCFLGVPVVPKPLTDEISFILLPITIIGGLLALTTAIFTTQRRIAEQSELKLAQSIISSGHEYYDKLSAMSENLGRQRHDHKFHIRTIQSLLENNNNEDAKIYLQTLTQCRQLKAKFPIKSLKFGQIIN